MKNSARGKRGFTLLEVLLSVALIAILSGLTVPVYVSLQASNDLDIAVTSVAQTFRRAQVLARAADGDSSWGVYVQAEGITLFQGASYGSRDSDFDEVFSISPALAASGTQEFVYVKFSGLPQTTGTLTLALNEDDTRDITVNEKGTIIY